MGPGTIMCPLGKILLPCRERKFVLGYIHIKSTIGLANLLRFLFRSLQILEEDFCGRYPPDITKNAMGYLVEDECCCHPGWQCAGGGKVNISNE